MSGDFVGDDFPTGVGEYRSTLRPIACPGCGKTYTPRSGMLFTACEECLAKPLGRPVSNSTPPEAA